MASALDLARRIEATAAGPLDNLKAGMDAKGWPPAFQAIILNTVARKAIRMAVEAETVARKEDKGGK